MELIIEVDDPLADDVRSLLTTHLAFSRRATPVEYSFALEVEELAQPEVTFLSARQSGRLLGVAALKRIDRHHAELKSMHIQGTERRRGVGRALVAHILAFARQEGYLRVSLETGSTDEFEPARKLYAAAGFIPCGPFANYASSPYNTYLTIQLSR